VKEEEAEEETKILSCMLSWDFMGNQKLAACRVVGGKKRGAGVGGCFCWTWCRSEKKRRKKKYKKNNLMGPVF
jgi:hypothetical protein